MVDWIDRLTGWAKQRGADLPPSITAPEPVQRDRADAGEYRLLFKYLRDRYANRVVLTFSEIEDLIGFSLPAPARVQREWWGTVDAAAPHSLQSNSWTLANRTATVNLSAQSVMFERVDPLNAGPVRHGK
jgi:hypothetical protein